MASDITITAEDIIIDETTDIQVEDDDIDPSILPYSNDPTLAYLLTLGTALEVAFKEDFVEATASAGGTITSVVLAQNNIGTPFSTTVGVYSGIQTVDGNYVWLFQDLTHPNVVIGVIGNSASIAPLANGPLAFSFALTNTNTTTPDLYLVQYVPLFHLDPTLPDDRIDLLNKVFASATGTSVLNFSQLGDAPPGHNKWYILDADTASPQKILVTAHDGTTQAEVNISTQGLGVSSQDVRFGRELQIDLITGGTQGAGKTFTAAGPVYGTHIETVSGAGFSVSQSTPTNTKADIEIHAYNESGNEEGAAFPGDDIGTAVNITGVTFKLNGETKTALELGITVDLAGNGLILHDVGEGVTVDFTTAGGNGGTFDRFTIKNIDTEKDYFDVKEVHFAGETTNAGNQEVGSNINFDDDGPDVNTNGAGPDLTVDESFLGGAGATTTGDFLDNFPNSFGTDGPGTLTFALGIPADATDSGFTDTASQEHIFLYKEPDGSITGRVGDGGAADENGAIAFTVSVNTTTAVVTLTQSLAMVHNVPGNGTVPTGSYDEAISLVAALITLTAHSEDADGDDDFATLNIGDNLFFKDDGPSIEANGTVPPVVVDESNFNTNGGPIDFSSVFTPKSGGADGTATVAITYALNASGASGLIDTLTGQSVVLSTDNNGVVYGKNGNGDTVFTISVDGSGNVTLDQSRAVVHPTNDPNESVFMSDANLVTLTAIITDGDGDTDSASVNIGTAFEFKDDGPTITVPFDGDASGGGSDGTPETLANTLNASATGAFGYDIGADSRPASFYDATHSDFVDANIALDGIQIALTGTIIGVNPPPNNQLISPIVTLTSETSDTATFDFTFDYDKDPADDTQIGTAGGTLVFDKDAGTYTITLTDPLEGFSFDLIHTSELLSKHPTSNVGHPQIVVEQLQADDTNTGADEDFYVQFTGNAINRANPFGLTPDGEGKSNPFDSTFAVDGHDMVSNANETWVSATQSTNGVAGDTIQKGELLTLRFFDSDVFSDPTEATDPTATAGSMAIKFDGIGNSEDLMLILDLIDKDGADNIAGTSDDNSTITRAMYVSNDDIFRTGLVPSPYSTEFTLDNNDGLVIIEQNDYNTGTENYLLQGVQIMQSGNGITGTAIDLDGAAGAGGGSDATTNLVNFDAVDNDVLKITDIAFSTTVTETPSASLDFAFKVADADGDQTLTQHIYVDVG
ncbi:DUF5801 repeats-in-toxin domain-containing protein [Mesorhizobium sp. M1406]|uniref:DUF5801 repeats-in-toxin domain-containing protein n=1 Tax=Mesorhizobium sp. M1406 TaxID=2957099 RepID=UPI00333820CC